jgi:hypothetical protein
MRAIYQAAHWPPHGMGFHSSKGAFRKLGANEAIPSSKRN